jgi:hypothetical protein
MKSTTELIWYRKLKSIFFFRRRESETSTTSDTTSATYVDTDDHLSPSMFARLAGLKILAKTDTEDDVLKEATNSENSLSITDTLYSNSNDYPTMDESFFAPPQDPMAKSESLPFRTLSKSESSISVRTHHRSRSDGGACFMIPVGDTNEIIKGRFTLKREEVQSSYWKPRRITGPSRFHAKDI